MVSHAMAGGKGPTASSPDPEISAASCGASCGAFSGVILAMMDRICRCHTSAPTGVGGAFLAAPSFHFGAALEPMAG